MVSDYGYVFRVFCQLSYRLATRGCYRCFFILLMTQLLWYNVRTMNK